jgi:hypothetical protein
MTGPYYILLHTLTNLTKLDRIDHETVVTASRKARAPLSHAKQVKEVSIQGLRVYLRLHSSPLCCVHVHLIFLLFMKK